MSPGLLLRAHGPGPMLFLVAASPRWKVCRNKVRQRLQTDLPSHGSDWKAWRTNREVNPGHFLSFRAFSFVPERSLAVGQRRESTGLGPCTIRLTEFRRNWWVAHSAWVGSVTSAPVPSEPNCIGRCRRSVAQIQWRPSRRCFRCTSRLPFLCFT